MKSKTFTSLFLAIAAFLFISCSEKYEYPFQNPKLPLEKRVDDLVGRLTLEEKVAQMQNHTPAIERLGIPKYEWWNECLHGVGRSGHKVTVFPQAIGMSATFNPEALEKMGDITSTEARAIYNESFRNGQLGDRYQGLTFWTPNINIFRDPRWGRGQETYGEDPHLTSAMGQAIVHGLQGDDPVYLKTSACAKHYAVHSGPEHNRHVFDAFVSDYDLWDTYLPAFHDLVVNSKVSSVMCAYNRLDGEPCCGSNRLMVQILRNRWNFTGYVTSDCGAIDDFYRHHKTHPDPASASADAVLSGTDLDCGQDAYKALVEAVELGLITEEEIDVSVKRLFMIRFRLGMFDADYKYNSISYNVLEKAEHKEHALEMARQSMVLLKNADNILPLSGDIKKIAVIGPNANDSEVQLGNYNGFPTQIITPLIGLQAGTNAEILYAKATGHISSLSAEEEKEALKIVDDADIVIFVGGITPALEGEEMEPNPDLKGFYRGDRTTIALPKVQTDFMKKVKARNKALIFVCMSGSAIGFEWEAENADAILQAWYGGESAGTAIADVLYGKYNPNGRLPVTFYKNDSDLPDFEDYSMTNRTYRYFKGEALFPFGFGLSYTQFDYEWIRQPEKQYTAEDTITCRIALKNTGVENGTEVVQVYVCYPEGSHLPLKELRQFDRMNINVDEKAEFEINIPIEKLSKWDESVGRFSVTKGAYRLFAGSHSADEKLVATFRIN